MEIYPKKDLQGEIHKSQSVSVLYFPMIERKLKDYNNNQFPEAKQRKETLGIFAYFDLIGRKG